MSETCRDAIKSDHRIWPFPSESTAENMLDNVLVLEKWVSDKYQPD